MSLMRERRLSLLADDMGLDSFDSPPGDGRGLNPNAGICGGTARSVPPREPAGPADTTGRGDPGCGPRRVVAGGGAGGGVLELTASDRCEAGARSRPSSARTPEPAGCAR